MKTLMLASAMVTIFMSAAAAETRTAANAPVKMVLYLRPLMCPATNDLVLYWARRSAGIASFAAATVAAPLVGECDKRAQTRIGFSKGSTSAQQADSAALEKCNALNAGNPQLGPCVVVGRLRPAPA